MKFGNKPYYPEADISNISSCSNLLRDAQEYLDTYPDLPGYHCCTPYQHDLLITRGN